MTPPVDLQARTRELRALAREPASVDAWATARRGLDSKFEGLQAAAAKALGAWGGDEAVAELKKRLDAALKRPHGWSLRSVIIRALAGWVRRDDAAWIAERYFAQKDHLVQHELVRLAAALPPTAISSHFAPKTRDADATVRLVALKVISFGAYSDHQAAVEPFLRDPDPRVRRLARWVAERRRAEP